MNPDVAPLETTELYDLLNYAPMGVLVEDCAGRIVWMNHTLQWQLGVDGDGLLGTHASALPLDPLPGAKGMRLFRTDLGRDDGTYRHLKCIEDILPEYSETGIRVRYFIEASGERYRPIVRHDMLRLLVNRSTLDSTTGLKDRQAIALTLRTEVSRSRRYGNPLTIVVMRVTPAQPSGPVLDHPSRIMVAASALLKESTRWADSVGRYAAWELLMVLPETTETAASLLVQKIQARTGAQEHDALPIRFSATFGVAQWMRGDDETTLYRRASELLVKSG